MKQNNKMNMCDTSGGHIPDVASKSSLSLFHPSNPASQLRRNHHPEFVFVI